MNNNELMHVFCGSDLYVRYPRRTHDYPWDPIYWPSPFKANPYDFWEHDVRREMGGEPYSTWRHQPMSMDADKYWDNNIQKWDAPTNNPYFMSQENIVPPEVSNRFDDTDSSIDDNVSPSTGGLAHRTRHTLPYSSQFAIDSKCLRKNVAVDGCYCGGSLPAVIEDCFEERPCPSRAELMGGCCACGSMLCGKNRLPNSAFPPGVYKQEGAANDENNQLMRFLPFFIVLGLSVFGLMQLKQ